LVFEIIEVECNTFAKIKKNEKLTTEYELLRQCVVPFAVFASRSKYGLALSKSLRKLMPSKQKSIHGSKSFI
jgi:hypothetical protein